MRMARVLVPGLLGTGRVIRRRMPSTTKALTLRHRVDASRGGQGVTRNGTQSGPMGGPQHGMMTMLKRQYMTGQRQDMMLLDQMLRHQSATDGTTTRHA